MKKRFISCFLLLFIMPFFTVQANAEENGFDFECRESYALEQMRKMLNSSAEAKKYGLEYTTDDVKNAVQYKEYYSPEFAKGENGDIKNSIVKTRGVIQKWR